VAGAAGAAVLLTTGCGGGKDVTFTPAANSSGIVQPGDGSPPSAASDGAQTPASPVATPPNIVISTQGSSICVRNKDTGSQACVGKNSTAVVNGVVIVDGKVVSTSGTSGGGSVIVNGGGSVVTGDTPPVPTSGQVTLSGAVQWRGSAKGTCQHSGDVRTAKVTLADGGTLNINAVGTGVVRIELASGGNTYSGNWVGETGLVSMTAKSLTLNGARVGRAANTVQITATLDC
jgi:hypothetical protein